MATETISRILIKRFKRVLSAAELTTLFSAPITLINAAGSNTFIWVDVSTIIFKMSAGTNYDFTPGSLTNIYVYNSITPFIGIDSVDLNSNFYTNAAYIKPKDATGNLCDYGTNQALKINNDTADATTGTRSLTISFNYTILNTV